MFQRIEKKYRGYYIALYACEMGELGESYLGHYKIFALRPRDFWVPGHVASDIADSFSCSPEEAMQAAKDLALNVVRRLAVPGAKPVTLRFPSVRRPAPSSLLTAQ